MNHLEQVATDAELAVYVMASPDAQQIEFLPLKPCSASDSGRESLVARWPGRGLQGVGVIGLLGRAHMTWNEPVDHIRLAGLELASMTTWSNSKQVMKLIGSSARGAFPMRA